ncbi:MAG: type II secretion system protein [Tepidisphaerales bacterium]
MTPPPRRLTAFTLVELLVVIGIIAVLISILLPTLARARQHAQGVQCASNLRQLHISFMTYADKNNGFFPAPWNNERNGIDPNNWIYQWPYIMSTYVVSRTTPIPPGYSPMNTRTFPGQNITPDWPFYAANVLTNINNAPIRFCPTIAATDMSNISQQTAGNPAAIALTIQNYSYAINTPRPNIPGPHLQGYAKVTRIKGGATKPYLFDVVGENGPILGRGGDIVRARPWANFANATQWSSKPHNGGRMSNYLFYDGHVDMLQPGSFTPAQFDTTQP